MNASNSLDVKESKMVYEDRWYQVEAEDALLGDIMSGKSVHPLAAVPTGGGKTKILSSLIYKIQELQPTWKILVISHTESILKQDHAALSDFFPGMAIGLYSSGLKSRDIRKFTVAGVQSIYRRKEVLNQFNIIIVDEAHTVPTKGNGMYRQLFDNARPTAIRVGLTATPFRTGHGLLHEGSGRMFTKLSYDLSSMENFNRLVSEGYLTRLISKSTEYQMDTNGLRTSAGDFNQKDMADRFDRDSVTGAAVQEVVRMGQNYGSWLIFAIDIMHADSIAEELGNHGIRAVSLHSRSSHDRHDIVDHFKAKRLRCIVSVGMITTGFDAPCVDMIVLLRPTKSAVLHVQMVGRGLRSLPDKDHCLVLDFAGNTARMGPINNVQLPTKHKKGGGEAPTKTCPDCGCIHHPIMKICDVCGHEFEFQVNLTRVADHIDIVQENPEAKVKWVNVTNTVYSIHEKVGMPDSLRITYKCGLMTVNEYVCYDHDGYAKVKADNWVAFRWNGSSKPLDVYELFRDRHFLIETKSLLIDTSSRYIKIKDVKF